MKRINGFIDKNDYESAKKIAGEAIRYQKEANLIYRFVIKMTAVRSKLESAARTQQVSKQITNSIPALKNCLMMMEKSGAVENMAALQSVFEDHLDVTDPIGLPDVETAEDNNTTIMALLQQMQSERYMGEGGRMN